MTCRDAVGFLVDYLAGDLPPGMLVEFDQHLAACADCREYLAQYQNTIRTCKGVVGDEGGQLPPLPDDLLTAIRQALQKE